MNVVVKNKLATIQELWPLLTVADVHRSIAFYRDQLGFKVVGEAEMGGRLFWCRLARGGASIMLQQGEAEDGSAAGRARGVAFYFVCDDVDLLYTELSSRGSNSHRRKSPITA